MDVQLIDKMGSDLTVVNAARVSFDKESDWDVNTEHPDSPYSWGDPGDIRLYETDQKLINFLARHGHWTPFSHVQITMRETVPIFVARQRFKHMVGFTYNEISRRYVDSEPTFYKPDVWRKRAEDKKQGSTDLPLEGNWRDEVTFEDLTAHAAARLTYERLLLHSQRTYNTLLRMGVAPEQARMVLPQSMYTSYYVTGSLAAWSRAYKLRAEETAQKEIQYLAQEWDSIIGGLPELKHSWKALTNG